MKSVPRFKFPKSPIVDSYGDITMSKSGMITIKGKTLAKLERAAAKAGLSVKEYFEELVHRMAQDPEFLENLISELSRERRRLISWRDRHSMRRAK
jgi:hypothetical protein